MKSRMVSIEGWYYGNISEVYKDQFVVYFKHDESTVLITQGVFVGEKGEHVSIEEVDEENLFFTVFQDIRKTGFESKSVENLKSPQQ